MPRHTRLSGVTVRVYVRMDQMGELVRSAAYTRVLTNYGYARISMHDRDWNCTLRFFFFSFFHSSPFSRWDNRAYLTFSRRQIGRKIREIKEKKIK